MVGVYPLIKFRVKLQSSLKLLYLSHNVVSVSVPVPVFSIPDIHPSRSTSCLIYHASSCSINNALTRLSTDSRLGNIRITRSHRLFPVRSLFEASSSRMFIALGAFVENTSSVKFRICRAVDMSGASKIALKV